MTHVDARGDACPLPVVKAKRAISELKVPVRWKFWWTTRSPFRT